LLVLTLCTAPPPQPPTHTPAGLSLALGAFLAGLLIAETEYALQVESDIMPFKGLLMGLFFMTVGKGQHTPGDICAGSSAFLYSTLIKEKCQHTVNMLLQEFSLWYCMARCNTLPRFI
jgi:hypothetical protein